MDQQDQTRIGQLLELKERSHWVTNHIPIMLAYWDRDQICRFANQAYRKWFGFNPEEIINKMTLKELLGPLFEQNFGYFEEALKGHPQQFEREIIIPSGEKRFVEANYYPDLAEGEVKGIIAQITDITRMKDLEIELLRSERKFKMLLNSSPDAVIITNGAGYIHFVNTQAEVLFGYPRAELFGKKIETLFEGSTRFQEGESKPGFSPKTPGGIASSGSQIFGQSKNQNKFPIEINVSPIALEDGVHVMASIRDISYRKEQEKLVNELALIINTSSDAIFSKSLDGTILTWNKGAENILGYTFDEIVGKNSSLIIPDDIAKVENIIIEQLLKGEKPKPYETFRLRKDKTLIHVSSTFSPILDIHGQVAKISVILRDITEKKLKEEEKQRIEEILDKTNEVARIGTWEVDLIHNKTNWSRITKEIQGVDPSYQPDIDKAFQFFKEGRSREMIRNAFQEAILKGTPYDLELEVVNAQGKELWVRNIGQSEFKDNICQRVYGVFQDIDQVKRAQEILNKSNEELSALFNADQVSIISTDKNGLIMHFNKGSENLLLYTAEEVIGKMSPVQFHLNQEILERGLVLSKQLGISVQGFDVLVEMAKRNTHESRPWTYLRKDGTTFPAQLVVSAIRDKDQNISGFFGIATDITEIKLAADVLKSHLELLTQQNNRLKSFANIVSHNLHSNSSHVHHLLEILLEAHPELKEDIVFQHLQTSSVQLSDTVEDLYKVSNTYLDPHQKLAPVHLFQALSNVLEKLKDPIKNSGVNIISRLDQGINILGITSFVENILSNFISNGIKFRSPDRKPILNISALETGEEVILIIQDNGLGIDLKKFSSKIFGMYQIFHPREEARGVGLFITKNEIEALGGRVEVESEVNVGTTFRIYFKRS